MANPEQQGLKRGSTEWRTESRRKPKWLIQNNKDWNPFHHLSDRAAPAAEMANPEQQGLKQDGLGPVEEI